MSSTATISGIGAPNSLAPIDSFAQLKTELSSAIQQTLVQSKSDNKAQSADTLISAAVPATAALYFSPALRVDPDTQLVIYIQRNSETGDVIRQYPSEEVVKAYKQTLQEKLGNSSHTAAPKPDISNSSDRATSSLNSHGYNVPPSGDTTLKRSGDSRPTSSIPADGDHQHTSTFA